MTAAEWQSKLQHGERLLWTGSPTPGLLLVRRDLFLVPFSVVWTGFVAMVAVTTWTRPSIVGMSVAVAVLLVFGLVLAVGRFPIDAWLRRRISYALTSRRVLIWRQAPFASFVSIELDRLPAIELIGSGKPRGTIRFGSAASLWQSWGIWFPSLDPTTQLLMIEQPDDVFRRIQEASRALRSQATPPSHKDIFIS